MGKTDYKSASDQYAIAHEQRQKACRCELLRGDSES
jgi:hypothetical protein